MGTKPANSRPSENDVAQNTDNSIGKYKTKTTQELIFAYATIKENENVSEKINDFIVELISNYNLCQNTITGLEATNQHLRDYISDRDKIGL